ncbi:16S rRNA (guanine(966)-N(2))-methyltransferase RsmD [Anoxybacillus rupiensis]|uniref:16S rRNA (Guanine(966)-N(2))-methyltransferase RsmD n=1 Tax=Anoxybacteroides rupiense TaxID=311460 RepID=A0ABD5IRC2_9BACL|nr:MULTISPECIES: 16S rRNA (guanine(966)-N(2))-methyltransferase RsmD [Anoxybacillus]MBB3906278.1 16S rRNA (guanine(966)-N(2))-methyltransferase RsmD [Anoxybacillus rupiensis]MBS2770738.1 16S rRNA (guanine(966)-N(2))-methyltransferase RsmD [Anoxybacillus rupiensis]MDE8563004.1 16S rRNA (guanine(966)-N(2))-methyltransferase RsmD [Anoxybacillus rupiensis]MED5050379.1 16S rRNA (guanine(966)-N(2))-methyltransferase RsmD [Anoxybacillus rupiensis]OQM46330.1 16S rRNA (guanine(966)-N(2))-methyltransfer
MRVISGKCKGRVLQAVPGMSTRPTTDKVKEAIFNMVGPYFSGGIGLDLFGGSGGLGIEALSRGLHSMIFVDHDAKAVQTIRKNVEACGLKEQSEIYRNDAERALKAIIKRQLRFHLIFLDPPYKKQKLQALISFIDEHSLLEKNGFIVAEHAHDIELPDRIGNLVRIKHEVYGITAVSIYAYTQKGE